MLNPTYKENSLKVYIGTVGFGQISAGSHDLHDVDFRTLPGYSGPVQFSAGDVGTAIVLVLGAGASGGNLVTKIATYTSPTEVQLVDAAGTLAVPGTANVIVFRSVTCREGSISHDDSVTDRDQGAFTVRLKNGALPPVAGQPFLICSTDPATGWGTYGAFFGGEIDSVKTPNQPGAAGYLESECQCVSYAAVLQRRIVRGQQYGNQTVAQIATDVCARGLTAEFMPVTSVTGPTLVIITFDDFQYVADCLDQIVQQATDPTASFWWWTDPYRGVHISEAAVSTAPFDVNDADGSDSNVQVSLNGEQNRDKFSNQVYLKDDSVLSDPASTFVWRVPGGGPGAPFFASITLPEVPGVTPTVTVNGVNKTIWIVANYDAATLQAVPAGYNMAWVAGEKNIFGLPYNGNSHELPVGALVVVTYRTKYGSIALQTYDDGPSGHGVQARSGIEGGSGLHESLVNQDKPLTMEELRTQAANLARRLGIPPSVVNVTTFYGGLRAGQILNVGLSDIHYSGVYLIQSVHRHTEDGLVKYDAVLVRGSTTGDWSTALVQAFSGSLPIGVGALPDGTSIIRPLVLSFANTPGQVGIAYSAFLKAHNGTPGYTFSILDGFLPDGLTLNASTGEISGIPTQDSDFHFTAQVTDAAAGTEVSPCEIDVAAATVYPPPAPTSITVTPTVLLVSGVYKYYFAITVTFDITDPHFSEIKWLRIAGINQTSNTAREAQNFLASSFASGTLSFVSDQFDLPTSDVTWLFSATSLNSDNSPSAAITGTGTINVPVASSVTAAEATPITSTRYCDSNRSVYAQINYTPVVTNAIYPFDISVWINKQGATKQWRGWATILAPGALSWGQKGSSTDKSLFAPLTGDETWEVTFALGKIPQNATVPASAKTSSGFSVVNGQLPLSSDITSGMITIPGGAGGSFPYNVASPDGVQYWSIPPIGINLANAFTDPNAFVVIITAQDLSAAGGSTLGVEHTFGVAAVINGSILWPVPLEGPYGNKADPARSGSIGAVRLRFYIGNRVNQGPNSWQDATATTLQTTIDVAVAASAATPTGALVGGRVAGAVAQAVNSTNSQFVPGSGITGPVVNIGGGGALTTLWQVLNGAGAVVAWIGQSGTNYGLYAQQAWFGTGGPGPFGAKIWLDSGGNGHFTGSIESGSAITGASFSGGSVAITTSDGSTASLGVGIAGLQVQLGSSSGLYDRTGVTINSGSQQAKLRVTSVQFPNSFFGDAGLVLGTSTVLTNTGKYTGPGISISTTGGALTADGTTQGMLIQSGSTVTQVMAGWVIITSPGQQSAMNSNSVTVPGASMQSGIGFSINGSTVINTSGTFVGAGVNTPSYNHSCFSLTVGSGGISVPGGIGASGQQFIAIKDGAGNLCSMVLNGTNFGAVRLNFTYGVYCGLI